MSDGVDDFLEHHGVLGMHWGSRKGGGTKSSKSSPVSKRDAYSHAIGKQKAKAVVSKHKNKKAPSTMSDEEALKAVNDFLKQNPGYK